MNVNSPNDSQDKSSLFKPSKIAKRKSQFSPLRRRNTNLSIILREHISKRIKRKKNSSPKIGFGTNSSFDAATKKVSDLKEQRKEIKKAVEDVLIEPENIKNLIRRKSCNCDYCGGPLSNQRK
jgi:hypothetical protein